MCQILGSRTLGSFGDFLLEKCVVHGSLQEIRKRVYISVLKISPKLYSPYESFTFKCTPAYRLAK